MSNRWIAAPALVALCIAAASCGSSRDRALANDRRPLELDPGDDNARRILAAAGD